MTTLDTEAQQTIATAITLADPEVDDWTIDTPAENAFVVTQLKEVKGNLKRLEAARTRITKPLLESKREVDKLFAPPRSALLAFERSLKALTAAYEKKRVVAALAATNACATEDAAALLAPGPKGVSYRQVTKFRIVDATAVPRALCVPCPKLVAAWVKEKSIAPKGVELYEETIVSSRST